MSRVYEWIATLEDPNVLLKHGHEADAVLFDLLVHVAFADGVVQDGEFELLRRLFPEEELGAVLTRIVQRAEQGLNMDNLLDVITDPEDRKMLLTLAGVMAFGDEKLDPAETSFLRALEAAIQRR